ncbi:MAG TPA: hypothetical protein VN213_16775 [Solirubrobacteraceae bacterium]|nr:hypothetical protein [Solirubrobacteraceae bacterium]
MTLVDAAPVRTLAAAVVAAALVGCGGSNETADEGPKPASTGARAAAVPDELVGTWTRTIPRREYTQVPAGVFTMKVLPDGSVEMYEPGANPRKECITQPYCSPWALTVRDAKLTVGATVYCEGSGVYAFKVTRNSLVTKRVKDACSQDRPQFFDGAVWRRQS